jgi:hypothetical protein
MVSAGELSPALVDAYLRLLGLEARAPSMDALRELVSAHLTRAPFENISKLLARKRGADFIFEMPRDMVEAAVDGVPLAGDIYT